MSVQEEQRILDYIKANNGKYNGSEIMWNLKNWKIKFKELEEQNKIRYDDDKQKWFIKIDRQ